jgi:hypothetical protein
VSGAFTYRIPDPNQVNKMTAVRSAAAFMERTIEDLVPAGPEQTLALRQLQLVTYWSNTGIMFPEGSLS